MHSVHFIMALLLFASCKAKTNSLEEYKLDDSISHSYAQLKKHTYANGNLQLKSIKDSSFSQNRLLAINYELIKRLDNLNDKHAKANVEGFSVSLHHIKIHLVMNTSEKRKEFREKIMDSPAFLFDGQEEPELSEDVGTCDTLGISLCPEYTAYPTTSSSASFILYNNSGTEILCGEHYFITYESKQGEWYYLPINNGAVDIAYIVPNGKSRSFNARLYPEIHPNLPGRYRFFYEISVGEDANRIHIQMMTEFHLSDDKHTLSKTQNLLK